MVVRALSHSMAASEREASSSIMPAVCAKPASRSADLAVSATKVASVSLACASARVLVHALIPEEALAELGVGGRGRGRG